MNAEKVKINELGELKSYLRVKSRLIFKKWDDQTLGLNKIINAFPEFDGLIVKLNDDKYESRFSREDIKHMMQVYEFKHSNGMDGILADAVPVTREEVIEMQKQGKIKILDGEIL